MMKGITRLFLLILLVTFWVGRADAQTVADASKVYNEAIVKANASDPAGAIDLLKSCLDLCQQVGDAAADVKTKAENKLPEQYFNLGGQLAKANQTQKAIDTFKEAAKLAAQYKNQKVSDAVNDALSKLYTKTGYSSLKNKKVDEALDYINKAIQLNPNYGTARYIQCFAVRSKGDPVAFEKTADKGIEVCASSNDSRNLKSIQKLARDYFLQLGSKAISKNKYQEGVTLLQTSLKYDQSYKDTYYYLAVAQNGVKDYQSAAKSANRGLSLETGTPEKKAKYYFALGNALKGQGDKAGACAAYKNALYGPFKEGAKYAIEQELKCK